MNMKARAVALLSGGLDSILAVRMVQDQGVEVVGLNIVLPFVRKSPETPEAAAEWLGIRLVKEQVGADYIDVLRRPRYGYGKGFNPCIDCRIYMLGMARRFMEREQAEFVITGDVLKQRPKSQTPHALKIEDKASELDGLILRPLSALLLKPTIPEQDGLVDRGKLLGLTGRSRRTQLEMAERYGLQAFSTPAGGCPLTFREFGGKARSLISNMREVTLDDLSLLAVGRHFYRKGAHIVVGRNRAQNNSLLKARTAEDTVLRVTAYPGPVTLIRGPFSWEAMLSAARLSAAYSGAPSDAEVPVEYATPERTGTILIEPSALPQQPPSRTLGPMSCPGSSPADQFWAE